MLGGKGLNAYTAVLFHVVGMGRPSSISMRLLSAHLLDEEFSNPKMELYF